MPVPDAGRYLIVRAGIAFVLPDEHVQFAPISIKANASFAAIRRDGQCADDRSLLQHCLTHVVPRIHTMKPGHVDVVQQMRRVRRLQQTIANGHFLLLRRGEQQREKQH